MTEFDRTSVNRLLGAGKEATQLALADITGAQVGELDPEVCLRKALQAHEELSRALQALKEACEGLPGGRAALGTLPPVRQVETADLPLAVTLIRPPGYPRRPIHALAKIARASALPPGDVPTAREGYGLLGNYASELVTFGLIGTLRDFGKYPEHVLFRMLASLKNTGKTSAQLAIKFLKKNGVTFRRLSDRRGSL